MSDHANSLGRWAVIDIETSGIDPMVDSIIDVGFLQFEGTKLVKKYQSLVKFPMSKDRHDHLNHFVQKLTGITPEMLKHAPPWSEVNGEILELADHHLIAHNADFEKSFLQIHFAKIDSQESYEDSLPFLGLLHPGRSSLNLESFILDYKLADKELHRGLEDSLDLLKVMLTAVYKKKFTAQKPLIDYNSLMQKHRLQDWWWFQFYNLSKKELFELAQAIDFDLESAVSKLNEKEEVATTEENGPFNQESFNADSIKKILRDEKTLKSFFPTYRFRQSQEDLSLRCGQSLKNNIHCMVQAPTGTGKTLGYLLPAGLFAINEGQQVLVATGTKTLQHQALVKDFPQLKKLINQNGRPRIARLVGCSNHFCELIYRNDDNQNSGLDLKSFEEKFVDLYFDIFFHHNSQVTSQKAYLRDDFPYVLKRKYPLFQIKEKELVVDFRACTGSKCPFANDCSYIKGLREAREADIILGNHALMFTWPKATPRPSHIIVDEAHKIENEATNAFTVGFTHEDLDISIKSIANLQGLGSLFYLLSKKETNEGESTPIINKLREEANQTASILSDHARDLPLKIEAFFKKRPNYSDLYKNEYALHAKKSHSDKLLQAILDSFESIKFSLGHFYETLAPYLARWDVNTLNDEQEIMALTRFEAFLGHIEDMQKGLNQALHSEDIDWARTLSYTETTGFEISASPIDVGRILHDSLLATTSSVFFTSATLGNATGNVGTKGIEWSTGHLYLTPEKRFKHPFFLPSPFDYEKKTKIFFCDDVPNLGDPTYVQTVLDGLAPIIDKLEGRCLLLFSAKTRFETAREILIERYESRIPLFLQGMGNNVIEDFKRAGRGLLVGMESFGEGIDIPGEALQFVFIDKIPDLRQDHVIEERKAFFDREIGNSFEEYYLAHRTRSLHQKLGRLLRTETDYGAVIVADNRIKRWQGRTIQKLMTMMEPYKPYRTSFDDAVSGTLEFLNNQSH